jgi:seryl-tRNA synthetase
LGSKALGRNGRVLRLNRSPRTWKRNFRRQQELRKEFRPTIRKIRHGARNKNETKQTQSKKLKKSLKELKEGLSFDLLARR